MTQPERGSCSPVRLSLRKPLRRSRRTLNASGCEELRCHHGEQLLRQFSPSPPRIMNLSRHGTIFPGADSSPRPFLPQARAHRSGEGDAGGRARGSPATRLYPGACPGTSRALLEALVPAPQHTNAPRTPRLRRLQQREGGGGGRDSAPPAAPPPAGRGGRHLAGRRCHLSAGVRAAGGRHVPVRVCVRVPAPSGGAVAMSPAFPGPISPPCA